MGKFSSSFMYKSPLNGAYTSGASQGSTYVSNREAFQQLQDVKWPTENMGSDYRK